MPVAPTLVDPRWTGNLRRLRIRIGGVRPDGDVNGRVGVVDIGHSARARATAENRSCLRRRNGPAKSPTCPALLPSPPSFSTFGRSLAGDFSSTSPTATGRARFRRSRSSGSTPIRPPCTTNTCRTGTWSTGSSTDATIGRSPCRPGVVVCASLPRSSGFSQSPDRGEDQNPPIEAPSVCLGSFAQGKIAVAVISLLGSRELDLAVLLGGLSARRQTLDPFGDVAARSASA